MRLTLTTLMLLLISTALPALAQDPKPAQKPITVIASDSEQPKNEVEKLLAEAAKRGETVLKRCINDCGEDTQTTAGLELGRATHLATPAYPPIARAAHAEGEVLVQVIIDETGRVIAAAAISGHPLLQSTSVRAARESVFSPTKLEGVPVKVTGVLRYNFIAQ
jgi:TonB family protein